jgi:soluble lytic murein transglycosylase
MNKFIISLIITLASATIAHANIAADPEPLKSFKNFISSDRLGITRSEFILAEQITNLLKLIEKGYVNQDLLKKTANEVEKSKHFRLFAPWLRSIESIQKSSGTNDLILNCSQYTERREIASLERSLERMVGNYCREKALEVISKALNTKPILTDEMLGFLQSHLRFFIVKKNKRNFAFFIQSLSTKPDLLKQVSQLVTSYSVSQQVVPGQEVLKDIVLNEQITKLIQDKGFGPLQHKNVFYAEYSTLIQTGYRTLDKDINVSEKKVRDHYNFLKNYLELNQDHLPLGLCLTRLNDFTKSVFRAGFKDLAREMYSYITGKNNKEILEDAHFFHMWTYLFHNEFNEALKLADKLGLTKQPSNLSDPRLKFWIGYSYEKTEKLSDAISWYESVVENNPLSYYSIMSVKKLQILKPDSPVVRFYSTNAAKVEIPLSFDQNVLSDDHASSLIRLRAWAKLDNQKMMRIELRRLNKYSTAELLAGQPPEKHKSIQSELHIVNAKLIQESQNYLSTFKYLYTVMEKKEVFFNRALLELLYPKPFFEDLQAILKKDNLDPLIVLSLIRQESVFNPQARSPVGARGLMQLMPATARRLRGSVRDKHLTNPKLNIELGTQYFKNLVKRYDGNLVFVLSAYNAGESRVERWKSLYWDSDDSILKNIEAIPFLETRNYVKLIFRNIFFYKLLMDQPEIADSGEFNRIYDVSLGFKH